MLVARLNMKNLALASFVVLTPAVGTAATVTPTNPNNWFGDNGHTAVNVTWTNPNPDKNYSGQAGAFDLTVSPDYGDVTTFCVDLLQYISSGTYGVATTYGYDPAKTDEMEALFETAYSTLDVTNATQSAGFQLALWEIAFESSGTFNMTTGSLTSSASAATAFAQTLLEGLGGPITYNYELTFLTSATRQDQVFAVAVPIPAAGLLLLGALGGIGLAKRRRRALAV